MGDSGTQGRGTGAANARLACLQGEIDEARRRLASLRHEGERHFVDGHAVDAEVPHVLNDVVNSADELARLRAMGSHGSAVNRAFSRAELDEQHQQLDRLESRIQRLGELCGDNPHTHERHFIDR